MVRFAFLAFLVPLVAWALPTVIYDNDQTQSLEPFLEPLRGEAPPPDTRQQPSGRSGLTVEDLLPVKTPAMSPGVVSAQTLSVPYMQNATGARPLFLIGADSLSRRWLVEHRARLKELDAVGMLVQADTTEDLKALARIADGLPIMPASGSAIARRYALKHYPVLIWRGRIEQ